MATGSWPSLLDLMLRLGPDGEQVAYVAEMLSQANEVLDDAPWIESNDVTSHEFVFRTSIPAGSWRGYNMGTPYGKSTTAKARIALAELTGISQIDRSLAEDSGDVLRFRESEDVAFMEGLGQTWVQTLLYGNTVATPAEFMGLSTFYNTVSTATAQNASNVIDGGGVGSSNASIWLICWSPRTFACVYPRNSKAGLTVEDKGDTVPGYDSLGNPFMAYTTYFRQRGGLMPQDWRYGVRIANLDTTSAGLTGPNPPDLFALLAQAMYMPPALSKQTSGITKTDAPTEAAAGTRPVLYGNRTIKHWAHVQGMRDRNVMLRVDDYAGRPVDGFNGIPFKNVDQLLVTEARVT